MPSTLGGKGHLKGSGWEPWILPHVLTVLCMLVPEQTVTVGRTAFRGVLLEDLGTPKLAFGVRLEGVWGFLPNAPWAPRMVTAAFFEDGFIFAFIFFSPDSWGETRKLREGSGWAGCRPTALLSRPSTGGTVRSEIQINK